MKACAIILLAATVVSWRGAAGGEVVNKGGAIDHEELFKAVFPDQEVTTREETWITKPLRLIRVGTDWTILTPERSVRICPVKAEENGDVILFVAMTLDPDPRDPSYPLERKVLVAVVRQSNGAFALLHKAPVPFAGDGVGRGKHCHAGSVKTARLLGRTMVLFEYTFRDSLSTPRGIHTITNLVDFTGSYEPRVVWACKTWHHYSGASQPITDKRVQFEFHDVHRDGYEQIHLEITTVEHDTFVWDGAKFVTPESYPPRPFEVLMQRKREDQEREQEEPER